MSCRSRMIGCKKPRRGVHRSEPTQVHVWLLGMSHLTFVTTRLQRVKLRGRSSFGRSTVKSQILKSNSIIDRRYTRLLTSRGGFVCALILSLMCLVPSTQLLAQYDSAQISGSVHDQSGALIPNATVQIQNRDTGLVRQTVTNSTGIYILSHIPPGSTQSLPVSEGSHRSRAQGSNSTLRKAPRLTFRLSLARQPRPLRFPHK